MIKEGKSTLWLDFINYIFIPFYILMTSLELFKLILDFNILKLLLDILGIVFGILTIIYIHKRKTKIFFVYIPFIISSMITISLLAIDRMHITKIEYVIEIFAVSFVLWVIPNVIYIITRRDLFKPHQLNHIKKCPGCKRIIPAHMTCCGKCNYKES